MRVYAVLRALRCARCGRVFRDPGAVRSFVWLGPRLPYCSLHCVFHI